MNNEQFPLMLYFTCKKYADVFLYLESVGLVRNQLDEQYEIFLRAQLESSKVLNPCEYN